MNKITVVMYSKDDNFDLANRLQGLEWWVESRETLPEMGESA